MSSVGYNINQDTNNLFSYSSESQVTTIDPVSTGDQGWDHFLDAFNKFSVQRGGKPLFNQTPRLTPNQAKKAIGSRIDLFKDYQKQFDPNGRLLSSFFNQFLH